MKTLTENELHEVGFRSDNTEGYGAAELKRLNSELAERIGNLESFSDDWYNTAKAFADEVARR